MPLKKGLKGANYWGVANAKVIPTNALHGEENNYPQNTKPHSPTTTHYESQTTTKYTRTQRNQNFNQQLHIN